MTRIAVVGLVPFLDDSATASRLRSICLGLKEAGAQVQVFALRSDDDETTNAKIMWRGVECSLNQVVTGQNGKLSLKLRRFFGNRLISEVMDWECSQLKNLCEKQMVDSIIVYSQEPGFVLRLIRFCRRNQVSIFQHYAEHPMIQDIISLSNIPYWLRQEFLVRVIPPLCDGNIVISHYLRRKCKKAGAHSVLIVPAVTNTEINFELSTCKVKKTEEYTFSYIGRGDRRDDIKLIIEAAAILKSNGFSFRIVMFGLNDRNKKIVSDYINHMDMEEFVQVNGWVSKVDLMDAYFQTDAFLLLRTDDQSSKACFPTRLPEFLSYAKPVILSSVGDFPLYFSDMENALLTVPSSADSVAQKMMMLVRIPDLGIKIGKNGLKLANDVFNYSIQGKVLFDYMKQENDNRKESFSDITT